MMTLPASAEFLQIDVAFQGTGCASCIESLEGRLDRLRGVEQVSVNAERETVSLRFAPGNRVRLAPFASRITQDGTKILRLRATARGSIESEQGKLIFRQSGLAETYRLEMSAAPEVSPGSAQVYEVQGVITGIEPGEEAVFAVETLQAAPTAEGSGGAK